MTVQLEDEVRAKLDQLAAATRQSNSHLAALAIEEFVVNNEWQVAEITTALREADAGDFADDAEISRILDKWKKGADADPMAP